MPTRTGAAFASADRLTTRAIPHLITRCSLSISIVFSIGRASTVCPLPVIVVALNIELYSASSVAAMAAKNSGDIASLVISPTVRVSALSLAWIRTCCAVENAIA
jgi:hypothetical protein